MSKVRDLPAISSLELDDLFYVVDTSEGENGGRKVTVSNVKGKVAPSAVEIKALYESNPNTNAFTDASEVKLAGIEDGANQTLPGTPVTQIPAQTNTAGVALTYAKSDHVHNIPVGVPVSTNTDNANSSGSATTFARSDHQHTTIVSNTSVASDVSDTTTSLTDVVVAGMTITPIAGTYLVMYSSSTLNSANGAERNYINIYAGGTKVMGSERRVGAAGAFIDAIITNPDASYAYAVGAGGSGGIGGTATGGAGGAGQIVVEEYYQ